MSDVLFDTGKYTLRPLAREKLAKISGIVLAYPSLLLAIEGDTDSVGGDSYNQDLSEKRAEAVRDYLAEQKVPMASMTAQGFGKTQPVASNDTAEGRQQNRRVELVVSGDVIGTVIGVGLYLKKPVVERRTDSMLPWVSGKKQAPALVLAGACFLLRVRLRKLFARNLSLDLPCDDAKRVFGIQDAA